MGKNKKIIILAVIVMTIVLAVLSQIPASFDDAKELRVYTQGEKIPLNISIVDTEGSNKKFSDFHKKLTLINFWASWCGPCIKELPSLRALENELHDKGFRVLSLIMEEDFEKSLHILKQINGDQGQFILLSGLESDLSRSFSFSGIPYSVLIDKEGEIRHIWQGEVDWSHQEIIKFMENLL
ncbi:MAG: TlpA family protein disulfide reductase [Oligoflexia bacterium]|nr:TlpA family protein disulfide reductase [Oligoflexia bacterium]